MSSREKLERFWIRNASPKKLQAEFDKLTSAKDRLYFLFGDVAPLIFPKQSSVAVHNTFSQLTDDQAKKMYEDLIANIQQAQTIDVEPEPEQEVTLLPAKYNRYGMD